MQRLMLEAARVGLSDHATELLRLVCDLEGRLNGKDAQARMLREAMETLPEVVPSRVDLSCDRIRIGEGGEMMGEEKKRLQLVLQALIPWRKGPFSFFGENLDTEWESWMKWRRVAPAMRSVKNRRVLDIGSSSGYYLFRLATQAPEFGLGVDPFLPYYYQFQLIQKYVAHPDLFMLPCGFEDLPAMAGFFDTVLCMGILYHRRSPVDFLKEIRRKMAKGGELVMETMVIAGDAPVSLTPAGRYSKMRNIFFLPTVSCLSRWLAHGGFGNIRCVDVTRTTSEEQHRTPWAFDESLADFLAPEDPTKTVEGEPAPIRAVVLAEAV